MARDLVADDATKVIIDLTGKVLDLSPDEVGALGPDTRFDADGIGLDSLALLELAAAVATFFRLHESELEDALLRGRTVDAWAQTVLYAWQHGSRRLTFMTSGTSGEPEPCTHAWRFLAQEMDAHAEMFGDRRRVVGLVAPRHIYGFLFCVLLPRWLGIPFVDARNTAMTGLAQFARPGDLVIGFPLRWDLVAADTGWARDVVGVSSTGPISAETVSALRANGLHHLVEIYGSSQTGGVAWRADPHDPFRLYRHWAWLHDGRLSRKDPEAPATTVTYEPPDVLQANGDGFEVVRRHDGAVQVAGTNVSCQRVVAVVSEHPAVRECAVRLMRPVEGTRLKTYIVLTDGVSEAAARQSLRRWVSEHLSAPEAPAHFTFGDAIPRDEHGKDADWPINRQGVDIV